MAAKKWTLKQILPYLLSIGGAVGVYCAFILSQDKLKLIQDPNAHLSCSLNPIVACGSVIKSAQGHAFGFPNPFLGLAGFAVVLTIGVAIFAGATFKRWFWLLVEAGLLFMMVFLGWLFYESVYRIGALCPYCLTVDAVSLPMFWYTTLYVIDEGYIKLPKGRPQKIYTWIRRHHLDILVLVFLILIGLVLNHFWYYYGRNL